MQYHEIFRQASAETQREILAELLAEQKDAYKSAVEALAPGARVRPLFVHRMPPPKRHAWLARHLGRKSGEAIAGNILQFWLSGPRKPMLVEFLDTLGIEHEDGMLEELPPEPPEGRLEPAVETLLENHPPEHVRIYLEVFREMDLARWPQLDEILAGHPKLAAVAAD